MGSRVISHSNVFPPANLERFGGLIGRSEAMRRVYAVLDRISRTEMTVLLEGETGTGKELAATAIHDASPRASGPFVVFDCSAVPRELVESELFGHVRGAFTGAVGSRKGRFREADGGTLFLDEIGELPLELQPKLLRVLESRKIRPLGSEKEYGVDVRIIAATNRDLTVEVEERRFRRDLYHRLSVPIRLPPLRERSDDIPLLVRHFEDARRTGSNQSSFISDDVIRNYRTLPWPGNVRELRNRVDIILTLGGEELPEFPDAMDPKVVSEVDIRIPYSSGRRHVMDAYTMSYFQAALRHANGNVSRSARQAGVGRSFVQKVMKRYKIQRTA